MYTLQGKWPPTHKKARTKNFLSFRNILLEFLRCKKLLDHEIREEEAIFIYCVIRKPFDYLQPYHNLACCWRSIVSVWVSTWPFMINDVNIIASANNLFFLNDPKCSFFFLGYIRCQYWPTFCNIFNSCFAL